MSDPRNAHLLAIFAAPPEAAARARCSTHPGQPRGGCNVCDTYEGPDVVEDWASDAECDGAAADEVWRS